MSDITCAVIMKHGDDYTVDNLIVFDTLSAIDGVKAAMGIDYLLPVDGNVVQMGDVYDPEKDIYTRNGERIYPELSEKERIDALEAENIGLNEQIAQLENAMCEMDEANAERMAAIENALCDLDAGV